MQTILIQEQDVDIYLFPEKDKQHPTDAKTYLVIGDLHGNAIKLLYFLIRQNVLEMTEKNYRELIAIYRTPACELSQQNILHFNYILSNATIVNKPTLILLGDEFADRGNNDYFTLRIFEKIRTEKIPIHIVVSNHGVEFIVSCENKKIAATIISDRQTASLMNLDILVQRELINEDTVFDFYANFYKSSLCLFYSIFNEDENRIIICSHAPVGLDAIQSVADMLSVDFKDETAQTLNETVKNINNAFAQQYLNQNLVTQLYLSEWSREVEDVVLTPLTYILWNRVYFGLDRPSVHKEYNMDFVHGHDDSEPSYANVMNLESMLGKFSNTHRGYYIILYLHDGIKL